MENNRIKCPHCSSYFIITEKNYDEFRLNTSAMDAFGPKNIKIAHVVCPNPMCRQPIIYMDVSYPSTGEYLLNGILYPMSCAKVYPEYIPKQLRNDYEESCKIVQLSPKASATLARRCLQGIIRDFFKIKHNRLIDEVNELKTKVDTDLWNAIDAIRKVGNIGAHMEKDVNIIVDIDTNEAEQLIGLIELLFEETYIRRENRQQKLHSIQNIGAEKKVQRKPVKK